MKPAPFGYHRAASVADAVSLLSAYEGSARVIAGGQSLMPMLNMRLLRPDALVDVNGLRELGFVRSAGDTTTLGALVRHATIERWHPFFGPSCPGRHPTWSPPRCINEWCGAA